MALDPTSGSFTLLELVSHKVNWLFLVKVFRLFRLEQIVLVFRAWTQCINILSIAMASMFVMPCCSCLGCEKQIGMFCLSVAAFGFKFLNVN